MLRSQWNASMNKALTQGTCLPFLTTISAAKSMKSALQGTQLSRMSLRSTNIKRSPSFKEMPSRSWAKIARLRQLRATNHLKSKSLAYLLRSSTLPPKPCSQPRPPLRTSLSRSLPRDWARTKQLLLRPTLKPNRYRSHRRTEKCHKNHRSLQAKVQLRSQLLQQLMWQSKMCSLTQVHLPTNQTSPKKSWMSIRRIKIINNNSRLQLQVCLVTRKVRLFQFKKTVKQLIRNQQILKYLAQQQQPKKNQATLLFNSKSK